MSKNLKVGKIVNTHGLKGEVKVIPLTDDMRRFDDLEYVLIEGKEVEIEINMHWHRNALMSII